MKISFLIHNRYAIGGVIKSTANLAAALAAQHDVTVVSVRRDRDRPSLPLDSRVATTDLVDLRPASPHFDGDDSLHAAPPLIFPAKDGMRTAENTRLMEVRIAQYLQATDADIVISTHPGVGVCLGQAAGSFLKIAQIHQSIRTLSNEQCDGLRQAAQNLDAVISVSQEDAVNLRRLLSDCDTTVASIANCLPTSPAAPTDGSTKLIMAVGRLDRGKRYQDLIRAFAPLAAEHPDWRLRIYGRGPERKTLDNLIGQLGLCDHVQLIGASTAMDLEWPKAAIAVSASAAECLPMNLIEAMAAGAAVLSTDCDYGPREIITDLTDGLLVPTGDPQSLTDAMRSLIVDPRWRATLGAAARQSVSRYSPETIAECYRSLIDRLTARRRLPHTVSCRATTDGDIRVALADPDCDATGLRLLARPRNSSASQTVFRFAPLAGASTSSEVLLPRDSTGLDEGTWDLFIDDPVLGMNRRAHADGADTRTLLTRRPRETAEGPALHTQIPVVNEDTSLTIRSWVRPAHAEADRVGTDGDTIWVEGRLWGRPDDEYLALVAEPRNRATHAFSRPVTRLEDNRFRFSVPVRDLTDRRTGQHDVWDLYLACGDPADLVRIGRFLGDYTDKKKVHNYPPVIVRPTLFKRDTVRVRPFFTVDSELSVNAVVLPSGK